MRKLAERGIGMERRIYGGALMDEAEECDEPVPALTARDVYQVLREVTFGRRTMAKVGA